MQLHAFHRRIRDISEKHPNVQLSAECAPEASKQKTEQTHMHPEEIKAAMRMNGVTNARLADELGVAPTTISMVVNGRGTSKRIQMRISEVIGKPCDEVFPPKENPLRRSAEEMSRKSA